MILPVIAGIIVKAAVSYAVRAGAQYAGRKISKRVIRALMRKARRYGNKVLRREIERRRTQCKNCKPLEQLKDPCKFLRKGNPNGSGNFRGGSYGGTRKSGIESHHIPAQGSYPRGSMSAGKMPAIQMTPDDHSKTMSYGSSKAASAYRQAQNLALRKGGILAAFAMDVADIKLRHGDKYDQAILEAGAYVACISAFPDKYPVGGAKK